MTDKTPALPEPVAYQYRWKIDGEWVDWRVADASQKHPALTNHEERPLYPATALQEALDRADRAEALAEKLKLEAQIHAGEARCANSTIAEIYQVVSGRTGEPGNWNGAEPVKRYVATAEAALEGARKVIEAADRLNEQAAHVALGGSIQQMNIHGAAKELAPLVNAYDHARAEWLSANPEVKG